MTPTLSDLQGEDVQVWMVRLDETGRFHDELRRLLSPDELERADRFRFAVDQRRFTAARSALRLVLAAYARTTPQRLAFDYVCNCGNPQCAISRRKPSLKHGVVNADLRFNVSHTDDVALIAVAHEREVGIDVERVRPEIDWRALASEALSPVDAAAVLEHTGRDGLLAFYRCWAHKEAFLKAHGRGLTTPRPQQPQDLALAALIRDVTHAWDFEGRRFTARSLEGVPDDCAAALVLEAPAGDRAIPIRPLNVAQLRATLGDAASSHE